MKSFFLKNKMSLHLRILAVKCVWLRIFPGPWEFFHVEYGDLADVVEDDDRDVSNADDDDFRWRFWRSFKGESMFVASSDAAEMIGWASPLSSPLSSPLWPLFPGSTTWLCSCKRKTLPNCAEPNQGAPLVFPLLSGWHQYQYCQSWSSSEEI